MAGNYQIQKPYVLAELPRSLKRASGDAYVVGEVYGYHSDHGRRKRPELVVGINGEAANIYDIAMSRLVTSYPIPPQQSFCCPPVSLRIRSNSGHGIARYTYMATANAASQSVTVFRDLIEANGKTSSTSKTHQIKAASPVCYIGVSPTAAMRSGADTVMLEGNVSVVCADGEVLSLDPENLVPAWQASASRLSNAETTAPASSYRVKYVQIASANEAIEALFEGLADSFSASVPPSLDIRDANPDCLMLVSEIERSAVRERQFSVLGLLPSTGATSAALQRLVLLHAATISNTESPPPASSSHYTLHLQSGSLLELCNQNLSIYDLTVPVPPVRHRLHMPGATSFLRLSGQSILAQSPSTLNVYNPAYHSLQTTVPLDLSGIRSANANDGKGGRECDSTYTLITYFRRLDMTVGLLDNMLIGTQVDPPRAAGKRPRGEGMLIDSTGKGTPGDMSMCCRERQAKRAKSAGFGSVLPGSSSHDYMMSCLSEMDRADEFLMKNDLQGFEDVLAKQFKVSRADVEVNGTETNGDETDGNLNLPEWKWLSKASDYAAVDRRWIQYAISRVFAINSDSIDADGAVSLALGSSNVVIYLVVAGHLSLANVRAAFRGAQQGAELGDGLLAEGLVRRLVDIDPAMHLLLSYVSATKLGPVELLVIVKTIMRSLDYIPETTQEAATKLLTQDPHHGEEEVDDELMELDELERQLQATEQHIMDEDDPRPSGLMVALAKLGAQSAQATVKALRSCFKSEEILSLIFVLRGELVRGAWTSKYVSLQNAITIDSEAEAPPDESIALLAGLLSRCVDAIGPGGWLLNDSLRLGDHAEAGDLLSALRLEVSAALEGVEEAVHLNGILVEVLQYAEHKAKEREKAMHQANRRKAKSKPVNVEMDNDTLLPIALVPKPTATREKFSKTGEALTRTKRGLGYMLGQGAVDKAQTPGSIMYMRSTIVL